MLDIDFSRLLIQFLVLLLSLTVHEAAHAWSADRFGDPTARLLGRVSLNPVVHVDPIGTLLFPLIAMVTGAPLLGWAKPVPVNTLQLRGDWKKKFMMIAAAGPASNIVLAALAAIALRLVPDSMASVAAMAGGILVLTIVLNVSLAVFNMIPVPPLDGGNVLSGLLGGRAADLFDRMRPYGFLILYGLMFSGVLWRVMNPPAEFLLGILLGRSLG